MEAAPPSYEFATTTNLWQHIAPYLSSSDLCRAALVSREWHAIFTAELWGKPTSHFGLEYNGVLDHLARFQQTLGFARLSVRAFTYCLHLTVSEALYFDERPSTWLRDLLHALPNLQALLVQGVPFFDHTACLALLTAQTDQGLSSSTDHSKAELPPVQKSYHLRLLDASSCDNLTSQSLAAFLACTSSIVYLDLSHTGSAIRPAVPSILRSLLSLRILSIRAVRLTDTEILQVAKAVGIRLCVLDVRDNLLTSAVTDSLIDSCFTMDRSNRISGIWHSDDIAHTIYSAYTHGAVNRLTLEDAPTRGLQDLRIAGNALDETACLKFMQQPSLSYLDIGVLSRRSASQLLRDKSAKSSIRHLRIDYLFAEHLPSISTSQSMTLSWLSNLEVLTLTDFPSHSGDQAAVNTMFRLIETCAIESHNALSLAIEDYTAPPAMRGQHRDVRQSAAQIFALREIVLEVSDTKLQAQQAHIDASITGDEDSSVMWSAGEDDFSFFRDEEGITPRDKPRANSTHAFTFTQPLVDNLALLSTFRSQRGTDHDRARAHADDNVYTPGYWPGRIRVCRS